MVSICQFVNKVKNKNKKQPEIRMMKMRRKKRSAIKFADVTFCVILKIASSSNLKNNVKKKLYIILYKINSKIDTT